MTYFRILRCGAMLTLLMAGGGCVNLGLLGPKLMGPVLHVDGRWTGKLAAVPVYSAEGSEFQAAGLQIERGPRLPYGFEGGGDDAAMQRLALLMGNDANVLDPAGMAIGKRVEVSGVMVAGTPLAKSRSVTTRPGYENVGRQLKILVSGGPTTLPDGPIQYVP